MSEPGSDGRRLLAAEVPVEFCRQFCAAFRAGRCLQWTYAPGGCAWSAGHVCRVVTGAVERMQTVPGPVYSWAEKLKREC